MSELLLGTKRPSIDDTNLGFQGPGNRVGGGSAMKMSNLRLGSLMGKGAFCEVHSAWINATQEEVAIKRVRREMRYGSQRDLAVKDLITEIEILRRIIPHEHVVKLIGFADEGEETFAILELVPEPFIERLAAWKYQNERLTSPRLINFLQSIFGSACCSGNERQRKLLWRERIAAGRDLASALAHLHDVAGRPNYALIYRDLKPSNIGFAANNRLVLYDFGLAKFIPAASLDLANMQMTPETGSVRYMAPEVHRRAFYDHKADVYSLAIVLWQILYLETPFAHLDPTAHHRQVVQGNERPLIDSSWSTNLQLILRSAWAPLPSNRPNAAAVRDRLQHEIQDLNALIL